MAANASIAATPLRGWVGWAVIGVAAAIALGSAHHCAGSWHDGSRLAMVEALVDYHTWAIDDSIFVQVPADLDPSPYAADPPILSNGTYDKLFIDGHYYSDKPVAALLLAGVYQVWQWCGGATARVRPDLFCWLMVLVGAGLPYVIAVGCVHRLGVLLRLPLPLCLTLTGSFALATVALPYVRYVNVHIMLLAVVACITVSVAAWAKAHATGDAAMTRSTCWVRLLTLGFLAGLGYTLDVGAGTPLLVGLLALVAYRCRRLGPVLATVGAAMPWIVLHQAINYAIGGTLRPINSVPEFSTWPGCPFSADDLTGSWKHTLDSFLVYAAAMLLGKRGFLLHSLPMLLAVPAVVTLIRRRQAIRAELLVFAGWCAATWLLYAGASKNYSGMCCSIRWFVPFLAPAYYALAIWLRDWPAYRRYFHVLSTWGMVLAGIMWWHGPWIMHMVPLYWPIVGAALLSCGICWHLSRDTRTVPLLNATAGLPGRSAEDSVSASQTGAAAYSGPR